MSMIFKYDDMDIKIDDRILQGDKEFRDQIIDEQFIHYAISISFSNDFPKETLTLQEISNIVEKLIIADIGDIIGYEYWEKYGINAYENEDGEIVWNYH